MVLNVNQGTKKGQVWGLKMTGWLTSDDIVQYLIGIIEFK